MATSSFYNDNLYRSYPFVATDSSSAFPQRRLVGAKVLCSFGSLYRRFPSVSLVEWTVRSAFHRLVFRCSDGQTEVVVPITIPVTTEPFSHIFSSVVEETYVRVTVGNLAGETQSYPTIELPLEPTCVLWQKHRGVRSVRIGNAARQRLANCFYEGIPAARKTAYTEAPWWCQETVISDSPLILTEGFNCSLLGSTVDRSIRVTPQPGAGRGEVSQFVSLGSVEIGGVTVEEFSQRETANLPVRPDGLPMNDRILCTFCGATGPEITAAGSDMLQIRNDIDGTTVSMRIVTPGQGEC